MAAVTIYAAQEGSVNVISQLEESQERLHVQGFRRFRITFHSPGQVLRRKNEELVFEIRRSFAYPGNARNIKMPSRKVGGRSRLPRNSDAAFFVHIDGIS